jgi:phosphohistidine phosphatase SixA
LAAGAAAATAVRGLTRGRGDLRGCAATALRGAGAGATVSQITSGVSPLATADVEVAEAEEAALGFGDAARDAIARDAVVRACAAALRETEASIRAHSAAPTSAVRTSGNDEGVDRLGWAMKASEGSTTIRVSCEPDNAIDVPMDESAYAGYDLAHSFSCGRSSGQSPPARPSSGRSRPSVGTTDGPRLPHSHDCTSGAGMPLFSRSLIAALASALLSASYAAPRSGATVSGAAEPVADLPRKSGESAAEPGVRPTIVLLARHAEKAPAPADDPPLSEAGSERARALAAAVADAGLSAVIVTSRLRTQATAQPAAQASGLTPEVIPVGGPGAAHVEAVAAAVRRHAGGVVLVVGHSNTIPAVVGALSGVRLPDLCDAAYSDLFVLLLDPSTVGGASGARPAHLVRTHYGAPDDPAAMKSCAAMAPR